MANFILSPKEPRTQKSVYRFPNWRKITADQSGESNLKNLKSSLYYDSDM